jgi:hypothetical protein
VDNGPADQGATPAPPVEGALLRRVVRWLPFAMAGHLVVGVPALLLSVVVAWGTYVQAGATERMQQAATWPFVASQVSNYSNAGEHIVSFDLVNNGMGPALMGPVELRYRGKAMATREALLAACCGYAKGQSMQLRVMPVTNTALRPGETVTLMAIPAVPANAMLFRRLEAARGQVRVRACFCSVFDECWTIDGAQSKPQAVDACPADWTVLRER